VKSSKAVGDSQAKESLSSQRLSNDLAFRTGFPGVVSAGGTLLHSKSQSALKNGNQSTLKKADYHSLEQEDNDFRVP
jgi:hypothetical protein